MRMCLSLGAHAWSIQATDLNFKLCTSKVTEFNDRDQSPGDEGKSAGHYLSPITCHAEDQLGPMSSHLRQHWCS